MVEEGTDQLPVAVPIVDVSSEQVCTPSRLIFRCHHLDQFLVAQLVVPWLLQPETRTRKVANNTIQLILLIGALDCDGSRSPGRIIKRIRREVVLCI